jgi:hypothetical protein
MECIQNGEAVTHNLEEVESERNGWWWKAWIQVISALLSQEESSRHMPWKLLARINYELE